MPNILITGSTRGIGAAALAALTASGAQVVGHGMRPRDGVIGADLRLLTDHRDDGERWLRERLAGIDADARVERTQANLEDVFVAATRTNTVEHA